MKTILKGLPVFIYLICSIAFKNSPFFVEILSTILLTPYSFVGFIVSVLVNIYNIYPSKTMMSKCYKIIFNISNIITVVSLTKNLLVGNILNVLFTLFSLNPLMFISISIFIIKVLISVLEQIFTTLFCRTTTVDLDSK